MVCSYSSKRCFIVIFNSHTKTEPIERELLSSLLLSQRPGKEPVTSQAEIPNPNLSVILYFSLITLTQSILKPSISNKYLGMIIL